MGAERELLRVFHRYMVRVHAPVAGGNPGPAAGAMQLGQAQVLGVQCCPGHQAVGSLQAQALGVYTFAHGGQRLGRAQQGRGRVQQAEQLGQVGQCESWAMAAWQCRPAGAA